MQIENYISVTTAKSILLDMIRRINEQEDVMAITKNGVPKAILMSMEQYQSIQETMAILSDEQIMRQIHYSKNEIANVETLVDLEDVL